VSLVLANMLIKPIKQLIKTTEAITKGDTDTRVSVSTKDELGDLGNSLNAMADKFNQDIDHIQEAKDTQDLFLANLAHEIRTPLTSISGYSQMLKWSELSEEDLESVEYIHSESERLSHLSKDILKLTQLNNYELELRNVSTNEITSDLHLFMKVNSPETLLSVNLDESNLTLDYNLFKLMTYNIMTNSLNASKNLGEMSITGKNNQDNYEFIFEDNGPRNDHHLGLGLSIVKKVVELHQGTLEIDNKESSGVIVKITLAKEIN
jgi:signal transduction histidine kinase